MPPGRKGLACLAAGLTSALLVALWAHPLVGSDAATAAQEEVRAVQLSCRDQHQLSALPKGQPFACGKRVPRLLRDGERGSQPAPVLWSFPGSGNSYVRVLVEQGSGYLTGSVYHKDEVMKKVFAGEEFCDDSVIAIKSHYKVPSRCKLVGVDDPKRPRKIAVVVRHPVTAIFAEYSRKVSKAQNRHIAGIERSEFNATHFREVSLQMADQWQQQMRWRYSNKAAIMHTERFEDITSPGKRVRALHRLLTFIGVCSNEPLAACAFEHSSHPALLRTKTASQVRIAEAVSPDLMQELWSRVESQATRWNYTARNWQVER